MSLQSSWKLVLPFFLLLCVSAQTGTAAVLDTSLKPETAADFEAYTHTVQKNLLSKPEILLDADADSKLKSGEVVIRPAAGNPLEIRDGLIHDWTGVVFFPNAKLSRVLQVLQDFDHHSSIYPEMTQSRLLRKNGNNISGLWRIERKNGPVHFSLDLYDDVIYRQITSNRWLCIAEAKKILQVEDAGTPKERTLPEGQGYGFLWRLYCYWTIEARDGGVVAQCRTVSLSRAIPAAVGWIVNPMVKEQPRDSLVTTLRATRDAVDRRTTSSETAVVSGR